MKDFLITILAAVAVYVIADGIISVVAFALHPASQSQNKSVGYTVARSHAARFRDKDDGDDNDDN